jgi:hypothetical protein
LISRGPKSSSLQSSYFESSEVRVPRSTFSYRIHRPEIDGFTSPLSNIRSRDVYPHCSLVFPASESRSSFPSLVPVVPETWLLWSRSLPVRADADSLQRCWTSPAPPPGRTLSCPTSGFSAAPRHGSWIVQEQRSCIPRAARESPLLDCNGQGVISL